jgi:hypothetical protein
MAKKKWIDPETVEQFLARGGEINYIPDGESALSFKKASRHIVFSKKENPKDARRKDNERLFK